MGGYSEGIPLQQGDEEPLESDGIRYNYWIYSDVDDYYANIIRPLELGYDLLKLSELCYDLLELCYDLLELLELCYDLLELCYDLLELCYDLLELFCYEFGDVVDLDASQWGFFTDHRGFFLTNC